MPEQPHRNALDSWAFNVRRGIIRVSALWPETCTAVALRSIASHIELLAPFGVFDLVTLIVNLTPAFAQDRRLSSTHRSEAMGAALAKPPHQRPTRLTDAYTTNPLCDAPSLGA
jgi:hypothetical protein